MCVCVCVCVCNAPVGGSLLDLRRVHCRVGMGNNNREKEEEDQILTNIP